ncbi:MAG: hydrogenase nickel incorporation protein HypB [Acidobacteria bacterium]|nr:hydrogenase nickel incorporation protein HypB [Acidobacteriota bacterium]
MATLNIKRNVFAENDRIAEILREHFAKNKTFVINIIGSPGCGKTTLLEKTIEHFKGKYKIYTLVGDVQTEEDAVRLREAGGDAKQIITGGACHLDARMIEKEFEESIPKSLDMLIIENVGNLVCPSSYDLGEDHKVVIVSVPEGEEKPLKYPSIFIRADLFILSKVDYLALGGFDKEKILANGKKVNPKIRELCLSSRSGEGMDEWFEWIEESIRNKKNS